MHFVQKMNCTKLRCIRTRNRSRQHGEFSSVSLLSICPTLLHLQLHRDRHKCRPVSMSRMCLVSPTTYVQSSFLALQEKKLDPIKTICNNATKNSNNNYRATEDGVLLCMPACPSVAASLSFCSPLCAFHHLRLSFQRGSSPSHPLTTASGVRSSQ